MDASRRMSACSAGRASFDELVALLSGHVRVRPLGGGLRVATVRDLPGLRSDACTELCSALVPLAETLFPNNRDWGAWFEGESRTGLFRKRDTFFLIGSSENELIGFSSLCLLAAEPFAYFVDITGIVPRHRGKLVLQRIYGPALARVCLGRPGRPLHLLGATRNPAVYDMQVSSLGSANVFPKAAAPPPPPIDALAAKFADWSIEWRRAVGHTQAMEYDPARMVLRGYFPRADRMSGRDPRTATWFASALGPNDAFVVVCRATLGSVVTFPLRRAARGLRRAAAAAFPATPLG